MLRAYLFDQRHGKKIDAWADVLDDLDQRQMLWVDLLNRPRRKNTKWRRHSAWRGWKREACAREACGLLSTKAVTT